MHLAHFFHALPLRCNLAMESHTQNDPERPKIHETKSVVRVKFMTAIGRHTM